MLSAKKRYVFARHVETRQGASPQIFHIAWQRDCFLFHEVLYRLANIDKVVGDTL